MKSPSPQAGYNLVILMVLLTVLNIVIAASLPAWSGLIRRDKEEELIFRGLQYAEAIRVFQNRFGRPPVRIQELIEVQPRSIRKLWKDPMTDDGNWKLISLQAPMALQVQNPQDPEGPQGPQKGEEEQNGREDGADKNDGADGKPKEGEEIQVGPFKGVHSRSDKTSFLRFNGKDRYDEWWFTVDLLTNAAVQTQQGGQMTGPGGDPNNPGGGGLQMSARWIGRPIPEFLQPRQGSGLPGEVNPQDPEGRPLRPGSGRPRVPRQP